jgi:phenylpropionate dioxygenase-like ring-hydroxylating dioxygenase large terminal subunit
MLTQEENELLTHTGPGTPMGDLMRRYWIPVVQSSELAPGSHAKRVKLLGESLVCFRDQQGSPGLLAEYCSHRRASLYFGRVEPTGLRCVYHGWKYGFDGRCLDAPNEPPDSNLKHTVRHRAYPCREQGGVVWAYMGAEAEPPALPDFEWAAVPAAHRFVSKRHQACNYFQGLEGGIDSSHIAFLHAPLRADDAATVEDIDRGGFGIGMAVGMTDTSPRFEIVDTSYGALIGARRATADGQHYYRITQFLMPFYTMPPTSLEERLVQSHIWVPMDDQNMINWMITWHPDRPLTDEEVAAQMGGKGSHVVDYAQPTSEPYGDVRTRANRQNDYLMDWEAHYTRLFCGIPGFGMQDQAMQENQEPIYDRAQERLGTSDAAIVRVRRLLLDAARALRETGAPPPGQDPAAYRVRPTSVVLPADAAWVEAAMDRLVTRPGQQLAYA